MGLEVGRENDIAVPSPESRDPESTQLRFHAEILSTCRELAVSVEKILQEGARPLVLGGDHSIALGTVSGVASYFREKDENIGLLWFDAHGDMNLPDTSPSGNIHGMPLAHLIGRGDDELASIGGFKGKIKPENVALIGVRDIDKNERNIIRESGIHIYTMRDIDERGMAGVAKEALEVMNAGTAGFHLSFDVDGLDPSVAPGSGTLVAGGVSFREAHLLLEHCADSGTMVSMEVVELNPVIDNGNETAERVIQLIQSAFGLAIL
jgi:arginase